MGNEKDEVSDDAHPEWVALYIAAEPGKPAIAWTIKIQKLGQMSQEPHSSRICSATYLNFNASETSKASDSHYFRKAYTVRSDGDAADFSRVVRVSLS